MTQPGHTSAPTRHYGQAAVNTTFAEESNRGTSRYQVVTTTTPLADATFCVAAPCDGKIIKIDLMSVDITDAAEIKAITITNGSNTDASIVALTTYDDDPALVALTPTELTLSTTAANLLVDAGDRLDVTWDVTSAGTISAGTLTVWFESF